MKSNFSSITYRESTICKDDSIWSDHYFKSDDVSSLWNRLYIFWQLISIIEKKTGTDVPMYRCFSCVSTRVYDDQNDRDTISIFSIRDIIISTPV